MSTLVFNFVLLICLVNVVTGVSDCPPKDIIKPCVCRQSKMLNSLPDIICDYVDIEISSLIGLLSEYYKGAVTNFGQLQYTNEIKQELKKFSFRNITFEEIHLGTNENLCFISHVSPKAFFGPISGLVKTLKIRSYELGNDDDLYNSIKVLNNLEYVTIEGRYLQYIPSYAFSSIDGGCLFPKLKKIDFNGGVYETLIFLKKIHHHAFYNLPSLIEINFHQQDVQFVGDYAFACPTPSNTTLTINLGYQWNEMFTSSSFSENSLVDINRPVELILNNDLYITHLPETIFLPFLESDQRNRIHLGMTVNCVCNMHWLYLRQNKLKEQFISWNFDNDLQPGNFTVHCKETQNDLWLMVEDRFKSCKTNLNIQNKSEL